VSSFKAWFDGFALYSERPVKLKEKKFPSTLDGVTDGCCKMSRVLGLLAVLVLSITAPVNADSGSQALVAYERGAYEEAVELYQEAIAASPGDARLHHGLGRTYGRLAQDANWFDALQLAGDVRDSLERAVELDDTLAPALFDLLKFYASAPGFLGGGEDKVDKVLERLRTVNPQVAKEADGWLVARHEPKA
jgi:tetratricopeptide (TPR) repeat protein